jgi:hypothetical protein
MCSGHFTHPLDRSLSASAPGATPSRGARTLPRLITNALRPESRRRIRVLHPGFLARVHSGLRIASAAASVSSPASSGASSHVRLGVVCGVIRWASRSRLPRERPCRFPRERPCRFPRERPCRFPRHPPCVSRVIRHVVSASRWDGSAASSPTSSPHRLHINSRVVSTTICRSGFALSPHPSLVVLRASTLRVPHSVSRASSRWSLE